MTRPAAIFLLFLIVFATLVALLFWSTPDSNSGPAWYLWLTCGALCLTATAMELTLIVVWAGLTLARKLTHDPYVTLRLSEEDRQRLDERAPLVAMLVPAHREVSHPDDAEAFVARLVDMLLKTPRYAHLFLLFDSPVSEHENELRAVNQMKEQLIAAGHPEACERIFMETYRDKPRHMKNKPGSIHLWQQRYADQYTYIFMLDADSSLLPEDPDRPETCDALERLVLTLEDHPDLAMVQSAIQVNTEPTLWGWFQCAGVGMASKYHGQLLKWILEGTVPSYGHNNLFRVSDFTRHVSNTLSYLSHDFLDAADLETAGRRCVQTYHVLTREEGESSLLGFLMRDMRWARGNAQWSNYLLTKRGLPLGPKIFLGIGILCYVWPLLASVLLVASVFLIREGTQLVSADGQLFAQLLLSLVLISLIVPKALGSKTPAIFYGAIVGGWLMAPAVMLVQGVLFILGAFGTKWTIRGSRSSRMDFDHVAGIVQLFAPVSILGCLLWLCLSGITDGGLGEWLLRVHVALLIISPLLGVVFSCPLPVGAGAADDGIEAVRRASSLEG